MLDPRLVRANPEMVEKALSARGIQGGLDQFLKLDKERRACQVRADELKNFRNQASVEVGRLKKEGKDTNELQARIREVGQEIKGLDDRMREIDEQLTEILLNIPNLPHESVPLGAGDADNVEVRRWGNPESSILNHRLTGISG